MEPNDSILFNFKKETIFIKIKRIAGGYNESVWPNSPLLQQKLCSRELINMMDGNRYFSLFNLFHFPGFKDILFRDG